MAPDVPWSKLRKSFRVTWGKHAEVPVDALCGLPVRRMCAGGAIYSIRGFRGQSFRQRQCLHRHGRRYSGSAALHRGEVHRRPRHGAGGYARRVVARSPRGLNRRAGGYAVSCGREQLRGRRGQDSAGRPGDPQPGAAGWPGVSGFGRSCGSECAVCVLGRGERSVRGRRDARPRRPEASRRRKRRW